MPEPTTDPPQDGNRLLAALPASLYQRLLPKLEPVPLVWKEVLYHPGDAMTHVYFPRSGAASLLVRIAGAMPLEAGLAGNEGMLGLPAFLGSERALMQTIVLIPGEALRMRTDDLLAETREDGPLRDRLQRYALALLMQAMQTAACNQRHSLEERCASRLLMCHDRAHGDTFVITHEFLSQMLGVRRAGVTTVAGRFQHARLISYVHSRITILSRPGLEAVSCPCYAITRRTYDDILN